jgi:hypothetical protein
VRDDTTDMPALVKELLFGCDYLALVARHIEQELANKILVGQRQAALGLAVPPKGPSATQAGRLGSWRFSVARSSREMPLTLTRRG